MPFVPLINRTAFTFYSGAMSAEQLVHACAERGYPAAGLCDRDGLYAAVRFFKAAKRVGLKPVLGAEITGGTFRISDLGFGKERTVGRRLAGPSNPQSQIPNPKSSPVCLCEDRRGLRPPLRADHAPEPGAGPLRQGGGVRGGHGGRARGPPRLGRDPPLRPRESRQESGSGAGEPLRAPHGGPQGRRRRPRRGGLARSCPSSRRRGPPSWTPRATPSTASCAPPST